MILLDPVFHVHHRTRLGERRLLRVQFDLDELHVVAVDLVIDFVHARHG